MGLVLILGLFGVGGWAAWRASRVPQAERAAVIRKVLLRALLVYLTCVGLVAIVILALFATLHGHR